MDKHKSVLEIYTQVNPNEIVVGWYCSSTELDLNSKTINEKYGDEIQRPPIHLCVDTELQSENMEIKAYMANTISLESGVAYYFKPINFNYILNDTERISCSLFFFYFFSIF